MANKKEVSKNPADYPNYGLRHSPQHLKDVLDSIAYFPIEKQAEYADAICVAMINNHERMIEDLQDELNIKAFDKFNATAVGNIAYTATNSSSVQEVRNALRILELFKAYSEKKRNRFSYLKK